MITVHHLENSRSQRLVWLLEELGEVYDIKRYARDPATLRAPAELRAVHPLGKAPVLEHDGRVVAESGAIVEYLVGMFDADRALSPRSDAPDDAERMAWRYWMHYAEGSLMSPLVLNLVFNRVRTAPMPFFAKPIARGIADKALATAVRPQVDLHFDHVEQALAQSPWFAGERFSAADIQMSYPIEAASHRAPSADRPRTTEFLERIRARPAYQRAIERIGPLQPLA